MLYIKNNKKDTDKDYSLWGGKMESFGPVESRKLVVSCWIVPFEGGNLCDFKEKKKIFFKFTWYFLKYNF